jgi:hypothetical protein
VEASCLFYIAGDKLALALLTHYFCIFPGWKRLDIMQGFGWMTRFFGRQRPLPGTLYHQKLRATHRSLGHGPDLFQLRLTS